MSAPVDEQGFDELLEYLKRNRGFDFTGYKRPSLMRRVLRRMQDVEVARFADYIDYLEVHPQEFTQLFNTILINVTAFFRDLPAWEYLREEIVPRILGDKPAGESVRVWVAGCASGEEAYTVAMVLAETMGEEQLRARVKIYATDVDMEALAQARAASYSARELAALPPGLAEKYFEAGNGRAVFRKELRRAVIFGRLDLVHDAPISRVDLIVCRNTLMYFNTETQAQILTRFNFALNDGGFLFLGRAEMLFTHSRLFMPVDVRRRVFASVGRQELRDRLLVFARGGNDEAVNLVSKHVRFREAAFDTSSVAQVAIDLNGYLALANERARLLLNLAQRDIGRPLQELEVAYRLVQLRAAVEEACTERRTVVLDNVQWPTSSGDVRSLDVQVAPLIDGSGVLVGSSVAFTDVTLYKQLQLELEHTNQEMETAQEELQSTVEELETTNEELQSTNEELETTNEELQSTNEELETMNEELQSTNEELETVNEELQTVNEELRRRTDELNGVNAFMESIMGSLRSGVAVVDRDLRVQVWSGKAVDLWGFRGDEVRGQHFLNLDIGLPVQQVRHALRACLSGEAAFQELVLAATNRRGRPISCKVTCLPLLGQNGAVLGAIVQMEEQADGSPT
jgi:two-component system CheB/CheR fusion protein